MVTNLVALRISGKRVRHPYRDWARTQSALGNDYRFYPLGERQGNLRRAIAYYEQALDGYYSIQSNDDIQTVNRYLGIARNKLRSLKRV